jgi:response regulator RpfG family c-di-GMP phosphodiesterase
MDVMLPGEQALWARMSVADRRHAIGVARHVVRILGADASRPVLAAAMLHDVGKVDSNLGTFARVAATVVRRRQGESRFARYRRHDEIGAAMLSSAGSDVLTVAWAREHHLPPGRWTLPVAVGAALKAADND